MTTYYIVSTLLSIINLVVLILFVDNKKINYYFILLLLIMAISNIGYMAVGASVTVEEAVLATKISYIGGCFTSPIVISLMCMICKFRFNRWLRIGIYAYCFIVYFMVLTIGLNDLYYTEYYIDTLWDSAILVSEYGPGHSMFYLILYGTIIIQFVIIIYALIKKHFVSRKNLLLLFGLEVVNVCAFFIGRAINVEFEVMPALYVLNGWFFLVIHRRLRLYNIEESVAEVIQKEHTNGYIMFDERLNLVGANPVAVSLFPKLEKCYIDYPIKGIPELENALKEISEKKDNEYVTAFAFSGQHFECHIKKRYAGKRLCGYMMELVDDTHKWKHINYLSDNNNELENTVKKQNRELLKKQDKIEKMFDQTLSALSEAVDAKDRYTSGHSKRVAEYAKMIAQRMNIPKDEQEQIYRAGLLHDIGKIRIPVDIINKAGKLTDDEYNILKIHPVTSYNILRGITGGNLIAIAAKYHHERYDGKGYPNGLEGEMIPFAARILAVADSYDAMTSDRSYRKALPQEVARSEIEKGMGGQFDPEVAQAMLEMIDEDKEYTMRQEQEETKKILTIDDEPMNNMIIAHIMKDEPIYQIKSVTGGEEALEILDEESFDLIMLDVNMPGMSGLETLKRIREFSDTPIVLMSADKNLSASSQFALLGCSDYITKPFVPLLIKEVVHNMTKRASF